MILKCLFLRWMWLAILATCLVVTHINLKQNIGNIAEKMFAAPYAPLSDEDARELGATAYDGYVEDTSHRQEEWRQCVARTEDDPVRYLCHEQPTAVTATTKSELIADGHRINRKEFVRSDVEPNIDRAKTIIEWVFGIAYAIIGLFALQAFLKWFVSEAIPFMRRALQKLSEVARMPQSLKDQYANHKLRQSEIDFLTIKNLYDNGLITEEMFLKRKNELKTVLDSNEIFHDDSDISSSK